MWRQLLPHWTETAQKSLNVKIYLQENYKLMVLQYSVLASPDYFTLVWFSLWLMLVCTVGCYGNWSCAVSPVSINPNINFWLCGTLRLQSRLFLPLCLILGARKKPNEWQRSDEDKWKWQRRLAFFSPISLPITDKKDLLWKRCLIWIHTEDEDDFMISLSVGDGRYLLDLGR